MLLGGVLQPDTENVEQKTFETNVQTLLYLAICQARRRFHCLTIMTCHMERDIVTRFLESVNIPSPCLH